MDKILNTNFRTSNALKKRAKKIIPHLTQTFSRAAFSFVEGAYPAYVKSAKGCRMTDVDNNEYIDYFCGLGPISLGYQFPSVDKAIKEQLKDGILFSLPHPKELEISELICDTIPCAEMVKLEKTGSNAVTGAVRCARAVTKRDKIAYCGSGGVWHDWFAATISRDRGVPRFNHKLISSFNYNDSDGLEQIFNDNKDEIACVVIEPTYYDHPKNGFLEKVKKITHKNGSVLIFDEIVTGFRFSTGGAQQFFNVIPDIACLGKSMGNGMPISAIVGKTEFMKSFDDLWVSSSYSSELLSIAASIATIKEFRKKDTLRKIWSNGKKLRDGWKKISRYHDIDSELYGWDIRMTVTVKNDKGQKSETTKALLLQELIKNGIFMSPNTTYISASHSRNDIDETLSSFEASIKVVKDAVDKKMVNKLLIGKLPKVVYSFRTPVKKR